MRTKKRCTAQQFEQVVAGRQFTTDRLKAARMVLVDGMPIADAVEATGRPTASVRQAVQLIFNEVQAQYRTMNPSRSPQPGHVILTVEIPALARAGLVAGVSAAGGLVLEERRDSSPVGKA